MTKAPFEYPPANLGRILACIFYDSLLMIALLMVAAALVMLLTGGEAVASGNLLFRLYLLAVCFAFLAGFWLKGGQTLGMRTWRVKLLGADGSAVTTSQITLRFFAAILSWAALGLGFLWSLWDKDRRSWHDIISGSKLVVLPKRGPKDD